MAARHEPSRTRNEIEAASDATEGSTQTSIMISSGSTMSPPVQTERISCSKVACRVLLLIPLFLVMYLIGTVTFVVVLALLLGSFVALTMVQHIRHGGPYDKASQLKFVIRFWIFVDVAWLLTAVGFMYPIAKHVRTVKHVVFMESSIATWLSVIATVFGLYLFDFIVNTLCHLLPPIPLEHNQSGLNFQEVVFELVDCLVLLSAESTVIHRVSSLKQHRILGLHAWKWIMVLILFAFGYNVFRLCTHLGAWLLRAWVCEKLDSVTRSHPRHQFLVKKLLPREYIVYYANGLIRSINFIFCSLLILLLWVLYFGSRLSKTPQVDSILHFGIRTCFSLLVCSILWLCKTWAILSWESVAMYARLRSEILKSGNQLYFLGLFDRHNHDIFKLCYYGPSVAKTGDMPVKICGGSGYLFELTELYVSYMKEMESYSVDKAGVERSSRSMVAYMSCILELTSPDFYNRSIRDKEEKDEPEKSNGNQHRVRKMSAKKRNTTRHDLLMHNRTSTMHDIKQVSQYLISAKKALSDDKFVPSILARLTSNSDVREKLKQLIDENNVLPEKDEFVTQNSNRPALYDNEGGNAPVSDWEYFEQEVLKNQHCSESFIRTWLEKAQNSCLFLANALSSTKELVDCLNKIVSYLLVGITFLLWLILTGLATTTVLVVIASPLLAATFIFGDTCKTLFQGIMYVYVVHPIHVGDLCSVDDNKMVVKAVGVWTTTFWRVEKLGTLEEVTYPNSELANKVVINHLTEFDWNDTIEIKLGSLHKSDVKELKKQIEHRLNEGEDEFVACTYNVSVQVDEADDFKITIHLMYKISDIQDWSYFKCVRQKSKLKVDIDDLIRKYKEQLRQWQSHNWTWWGENINLET